MTETGIVTIVYNKDCKNLSNVTTVGKLCVGVEAKVIDENETQLGPNEPGHLCFKCESVCNLFESLTYSFYIKLYVSRTLLVI